MAVYREQIVVRQEAVFPAIIFHSLSLRRNRRLRLMFTAKIALENTPLVQWSFNL
jgi:hypothetical protein